MYSERFGGNGSISWPINVLVSDQLFQRHVRWTTNQAKDGYIKDQLESLLSVSKRFPYCQWYKEL